MEKKEECEENTFVDIGQDRINDVGNIVPSQRGRVSVSKDLNGLGESMQEFKQGSHSPIPHGTKFNITKRTTPMKEDTPFCSPLSEIETTQSEFFSCESSTTYNSVQGNNTIEESSKNHSSLRDSLRSDASPEIENALSFDQISNAAFVEYKDSTKLSIDSRVNITSDVFYERSAAIRAELSVTNVENDSRNICDKAVCQKTNTSSDKIGTPQTDDSNKSSNVCREGVLSPEALDFLTVTDGSTLQDHVSDIVTHLGNYVGSECNVCEQTKDSNSEGNAVLKMEKSGEIEGTNVSVLQNTLVSSPESRGKVEASACQNGNKNNNGSTCGKNDTTCSNEDQNLNAEKVVTCEECPENIENLSVTVKKSEESAEFDLPMFADSSASHQKNSIGIWEAVDIEDKAEKIVTREECLTNVENLSVTVKNSSKSAEFGSPVFAYDDASQRKSSEGNEGTVYMTGNYLNMLSVRTEVPHEQSAPTSELSLQVSIKEPLIQVNISEVSNTGNELSWETKNYVFQERNGTRPELPESRDSNLVCDSKIELVRVPQSSNCSTASIPMVDVKLMIEEDAKKPEIIHSTVVNNCDSPVSKDKTENAESFVMSAKTVETPAEGFEPNSKVSVDSNHTILMLQSQNIQQKWISPVVEEEVSCQKINPDMSPTEIRSSLLSPKTDPDQVAEVCYLETPTTDVTPKVQSNALLESAKTSGSELQNLEQVAGALTSSLTHQIQIAEPSLLDMSPASLENRIHASASHGQKMSLLDVSISKLENISPPCLGQQTPKCPTSTEGKLVDLSTVKKFRREEFNADMNLGTLIEESNDLAPVNEELESEIDSVSFNESNCDDLETNSTVITMQPLTNLEHTGNVASVKMCSEPEKEKMLLRDENEKLKADVEEMRVQLRQLEEEKVASERDAQAAYKGLLQEYERRRATAFALKKKEDELKSIISAYEEGCNKLEEDYSTLRDSIGPMLTEANLIRDIALEKYLKEMEEMKGKCAKLQKNLEQKTKDNDAIISICDQLFELWNRRTQTSKLSK